jgi:hypothetical protein
MSGMPVIRSEPVPKPIYGPTTLKSDSLLRLIPKPMVRIGASVKSRNFAFVFRLKQLEFPKSARFSQCLIQGRTNVTYLSRIEARCGRTSRRDHGHSHGVVCWDLSRITDASLSPPILSSSSPVAPNLSLGFACLAQRYKRFGLSRGAGKYRVGGPTEIQHARSRVDGSNFRD